jgi:hypothetical protein
VRRVFFGFLLLYTLTWGGHYTSGDGAIKVDWARALLRGSSQLDPRFGVTYSQYGIGHTLLALPAIVVSDWLKRAAGVRTEAALYTFLFILNGAWFLALVHRYLSRHYDGARVLTLLILMGVATIWWPYTKLDFSEPLVATAILWGFVLMQEGRHVIGFVVASLAGLIRPDAFLLMPLLILWYGWRVASWRRAAILALALLPALAAHVASNYVRGGHWLASGYPGETFSTPLLVGLYGILLSAGKSVFLFSPPLLLGVLGWRRFAKTHAADAYLFAGVFVVELFFFATWWDWSGDDAWGVRFLIPGVMLMTIPAIEVLERRALVAGVAIVGICVQLLAVMISGLEYTLLIRRERLTRQVLFAPGRNRVDFEDLRFNPRYSQIAGHLQLIRGLLGAGDRGPASDESRSGTPLPAALTGAPWRDAVKWDFIWLRSPSPQKAPQ